MSITRIDSNARISEAVVHGDMVYLAGQVGTAGQSITEQTQEVLAAIDALLTKAGSDKSKILQAIIWLADIADFPAMNAVWDTWVDKANPPARATGQVVRLADPGWKIEIIVTAAK